MRRDSSDRQWQEVKEKVRSRDKNQDRILRVLTVKEAFLLKKKAPRSMLEKLDAAHIWPVSLYPELMYSVHNIVTLNRYSHENLDNMRCPITGDTITYEERQAWWQRIAPAQWQKLMNQLDGDS